MSLKIRFRFDGRCRTHPRYNPEKDGQPQHKDCPGCDALWVIHLYTGIARRKSESGEGILLSRPEPSSDSADQHTVAAESSQLTCEEQDGQSPDQDTTSVA